MTALPMQNASTALAVIIDQLGIDLSDELIKGVLRETQLVGRLQKIVHSTETDLYLDVAHNPQSAKYLAKQIRFKRAEKPNQPKVHAILGMLEDKDINKTLKEMLTTVDSWYFIDLSCPRGASSSHLDEQYQQLILNSSNLVKSRCFNNIEHAYKSVVTQAQSGDIIIVFGSFYTVSELLNFQERA